MTLDPVVVGDTPLSLDALTAVARDGATVRMSTEPAVVERIEQSRRRVQALVAEGRQIYGVSTRFGGMATGVLASADTSTLQNNIVWVHKTGAGRPIAAADVRGGMLLRMNSLMQGASGVRLDLIRRLELLLNHAVTPIVYEFGSIGASGDLVPLSYVAGALIGSPAGFDVQFGGRIVDAREALREIGLDPIALEAKEGLALINGTSMSTAIAAGCVGDARRLLATTLGAQALMLEALGANMEAFEPFVHRLKPHAGQIWTADRMRAILEGSSLTRRTVGSAPPVPDALVQDRYSIRCLPQFIGPIVEGIWQARAQIEVEMNAVSDNPLIDESGVCYHGGNFLGQVPALAMDHLRQYLGLLAKHLDAQIALLMTPEFSDGLPGSLVGNESEASNMGLKGLQLTGNAMMPLLTFFGNTFVDRFATHAEQFNQNVNSLSYSASLLARESIRIYQQYVSVALLIAVQAVDLRSHARGATYDPRPLLAPATGRLYEAVRAVTGRPVDRTRPYVRNDNEQTLDSAISAVSADLAEAGRIAAAIGPELEP